MEANRAAVRGQRHGIQNDPDGQPNSTNTHIFQLQLSELWWDMTAHSHINTSFFDERQVFYLLFIKNDVYKKFIDRFN